MPTTPIYALPYPAPADPADVPLDMQELADRIEALFPAGLPGGELARGQITASVNITGTAEATPTQIMATGAVSYNGTTKIDLIASLAVLAAPAAAGDFMVFVWWDLSAGVSLGTAGGVTALATAGAFRAPLTLSHRLTPPAASKNYGLAAYKSGATGWQAIAGVGGPGNAVPAAIKALRA